MWVPPHRNYDGTQFAALRRAVEQSFTQAHDELSEAYYDFWRYGKSRPWCGYDVQKTPEASKALFDRLHALIEHLRVLALDRYNSSAATPDPEFASYMQETVAERQTRREHTLAQIADLRAQGFRLPHLEQ